MSRCFHSMERKERFFDENGGIRMSSTTTPRDVDAWIMVVEERRMPM